MTFNLVIWDWNGTLLNDVTLCVQNFNEIMAAHGLPTVSAEQFRSLYRHPVKGMYEEVGMVFDERYSFANLSLEWYRGYERLTKNAALFADALETLRSIRARNVRQILVSALEHEVLLGQTRMFEVDSFFDEISGHHDMEAESKIERGVASWKKTGIPAAETCVIGDSDHDLTLADAIGCQALLVDTGHQALQPLQEALSETRQKKEADKNPPLFFRSIKELYMSVFS